MNLRYSIGKAPGTDCFGLREPFTAQQESYLLRTREFVDAEVLPVINDYRERAEFPWALVEKMSPLGIVGDGIQGHGRPPMDPMSAGLINMEINRGDGSLGTFLAVQARLAMKAIARCGSEEQKQRSLGPMARLEKIGAFALTGPEHRSDSGSLETTASPDGESHVIRGNKKWIGNGSIADAVVVWARDTSDGALKGFLVEKAPPAITPGSWRARRRCGRSGRRRSSSTACGSPRRTGCRARIRLRTAPWSGPGPAAPARLWPSVTRSRASTPR